MFVSSDEPGRNEEKLNFPQSLFVGSPNHYFPNDRFIYIRESNSPGHEFSGSGEYTFQGNNKCDLLDS